MSHGHRISIFLALLLACLPTQAAPRVEITRLPDGAIQPRLARAGDDVHLLYFKAESADSRTGRLYHARYERGGFTTPVRVNETAFRHNDQIGKADMAIDDAGGIHIAWFNTKPLGYYYARSVDGGRSFAPARSLTSRHLQGAEVEPTIAARGRQITVAWHAGAMNKESAREVFAVVSADRGETFGEAITVSEADLGVCACCAMASTFDDDGHHVLAYRSAIDGTGRHMQVQTSGRTRAVGEWELDYCPVTSAALEQGWLVFETDGRLYQWHPRRMPTAEPVTPAPSSTRQKHPSVAVSQDNDRLIAWGEADGYFPGGTLRFAVVSGDGARPKVDATGEAGTIPEFSVAATAALPGGGFLIVY